MKELIGIFIRPFAVVVALFNVFFNHVMLRIMSVKIYGRVRINGRLFVRNNGLFEIREDVVINSSFRSNPIGTGFFTSIVIGPSGKVIIGNRTGISNSSLYCLESITIGNNVLIGSGCKIYDTDFHSLDPVARNSVNDIGNTAPVIIKDGAFIGAGATILKGVTIGENSVIGASSVVARTVPDNQIWAGNPAKLVRAL